MPVEKIDNAFISHASEILADTNQGLTGSRIIDYCNSYAVDFYVDIPITSCDFGKFGNIVPNKRTALYKNLRVFNGQQQFVIIKDLCELPQFENNENVQEIKKKLFERYSRFAIGQLYIKKFEPTGWERVDRALDEMKLRLEMSDSEEKFQAIGMLGRETLITIAQQVYNPEKYPTLDGVEASVTDAKRIFDGYLHIELTENSEKVMKFARSAVDLGNQLTHDRNAKKRDALICLISVTAIASLIKGLKETE